MSQPDKTRILEQIATISEMERGTLSTYTVKDRPKSVEYHKLQHWERWKESDPLRSR